MGCYQGEGTVNFYEANALLVDELVVNDVTFTNHYNVINSYVVALPLLAAVSNVEVNKQLPSPL